MKNQRSKTRQKPHQQTSQVTPARKPLREEKRLDDFTTRAMDNFEKWLLEIKNEEIRDW